MATKSPNILFIMTDNQEAATLGTYGNVEAYTPRLDALAAVGSLFEHAYCPNAFCSPCRASALTGLMPSQHGVHSWLNENHNWQPGWNALDGINTLPEMLKAHGYRTGLSGKYHLGDTSAAQNGFDSWVTMRDGHVRSFWSNDIVENGKTFRHEGHSVDFFTDKAIEFIEQEDGDTPFFLYVPYPSPYGHWPATSEAVKTRFHERFRDCPMTSIDRCGLNEKTLAAYTLMRSRSTRSLNFDMLLQAPNHLPTLRNYYEQVALVDENVGRLLDALAARGIAQDTLVVFTADHGLSLGQHGFWGHGSACWPSSMHHAAHSVPLILHQPGLTPQGQRVGDYVSNHDVFATILEHVGIEMPASSLPSSSQSLWPLVRNEQPATERLNAVFCEQEESRVVRTPDWLYFQRFKHSEAYPLEDELYDLHSDPGETINRIDDPDLADTIEYLCQLCDDFFSIHSVPAHDLWQGGKAKDNSMRLWLWRDAWGEAWQPVY
jgi:arylsulfatase A-like enzyme